MADMNSLILLEKILQRFKDRGITKVQGYNSFGYLRETPNSVYVSREDGIDTPVPFEKIRIGIEAFQSNILLYSEGPAKLREFGVTHVTSPVWAMLHLLEKEEYK